MIHLFDLDPRPVGLESGWELDVEAVRAEIERRFPQVRFVSLDDWNLMVDNGAQPVPVDLITADDTHYIEVGE